MTDVEPAETGVTAPTPWSIETLVAFALAHERVEESPVVIEEGFADKVQVGAGGGGGVVVTVTVVSQTTVPPEPVAVKV